MVNGGRALRQSAKIFLPALVLVFLFCAAAAGDQAAQKLHERAKNLYDVGDYNAALNLYEKILERDPSDGPAADLAGWCRKYMGDPKSAEDMFTKALTMLRGQDAVWVLIGLGELYLDGNIYGKALTRFEDALKAAPHDAEAAERASRGAEMAKKALEKEALEQKALEKKSAEAKKNAAKKPAAKQPQGGLADKEARQKPVFKKNAQPARHPSVYGVTLGANIDEALSALKKAGYPLDGGSFVKGGKTYYPVRTPSGAVPKALAGSVSRHFYLTAYNGKVLSVILQLEYESSRSFEGLKGDLERAFTEVTGSGGRRGVNTSDNIFSYEIGAAVSNVYGIWMYATDKGNGTCRAEIEHVDLTNLSHYWMAGGK